MCPRKTIATDDAPKAIGAYSQAARAGDTVYISGQIPLSPETQDFVDDDFAAQVALIFNNISAIAAAAGGSLDDIVRLTVYLVDLNNFATVNEVMGEFFIAPYPARAAVGVASLPKGAAVEIDAIMYLTDN